MATYILVADEAEARVYELSSRPGSAGPEAALSLVGQLSDPTAHQHDRDLVTDRPGRAFDRGPLRAGRRNATAHHGVGTERRPRVRQARLFAGRIATKLEESHRRAEFDRLILVAAPQFLGRLRQTLPATLRSAVTDEIPKDLVHTPASHLCRQLMVTLRDSW